MATVIILPDGIETSDSVILNNIYRVPKTVGEYKYIAYSERDSGLNFFDDADNCETRLNKHSTIIENPIAGWSEEEVNEFMFNCMDEQSDEWKRDYIERILKCYRTASENSEYLGYEHLQEMLTLKQKYNL